MPRLVCPTCKTVHQVSILQRSYRELPCRRCGDAIPVTSSAPSETLAHRPQASPASTPLASDVSGDAPYSTNSFHLTPALAAAAGVLPTPTVACTECGALHAPGLASCPLCGYGARPDRAADRSDRSFQGEAAGNAAASGELPASGAEAIASVSTMRCPHCAQPIRAGALKCRHCKRFVTGPQEPHGGSRSRTRRVAKAVGALLLLLGLLLAVLWIRGEHPLEEPPGRVKAGSTR